MVTHVGVKSVETCDKRGIVSPIVDCISLESLKVTCGVFDTLNLRYLNESCPRLKEIILCQYGGLELILGEAHFGEWQMELEVVHDGLKEPVLTNMRRHRMRVVCSNLERLVLEWEHHPLTWELPRARRVFLTQLNPKLRLLEVSGCQDVLRGISEIPSYLPGLVALKCGFIVENNEDDWRDLLLEHRHLCELVLHQLEMDRAEYAGYEHKRLILIMPSLERVEVVSSVIQVRVVNDMENVDIEYN